MAKPKQTEMFEQKRVAAIEKWADTFDEKRSLINGLAGERDNAEFKLREAAHANADKLDRQDDGEGGEVLVYKRGDYNVVVKKGKETVNVKIAKASKGAPPESTPEETPEAE